LNGFEREIAWKKFPAVRKNAWIFLVTVLTQVELSSMSSVRLMKPLDIALSSRSESNQKALDSQQLAAGSAAFPHFHLTPYRSIALP
jgi:hypothetical protein